MDAQLGVGRVLVDARLARATVDGDAQARLVVLGEHVPDERIEAAQEGVVADHEVGLGAQRPEHAGQFDGDVAGAHQHHLLGLASQLEEAVGRDAVLGTGDVLRDDGIAAGRDQDVLGRVDRLRAQLVALCRLLVHLDLGRAAEAGAAGDVGNLVVGQVARVDAVEAAHVGVALGREERPVKMLDVDVEAVCLGLVEGLGHRRRVPRHLLWHAPARRYSCPAERRLSVRARHAQH